MDQECAEHFAYEVSDLIDDFYRRGLRIENMMKIVEDTFEEYKINGEYI